MATTASVSNRDESITRTSCPECGSDVRTANGETWCEACGLVLGEYHLDHGFEPKTFADGENRERTGAPLTVARHDRGLSTEIGWGADATGRPLSGRSRRRVERLRKQHNRAKWRTKAERNLAQGLGEVKRLCAALELPRSVRDRAAVIFREAQAARLLQGRSIDGIAAASVYAACREFAVLRTASEVAAASGTTEARLRHDYGILNAELGLAAPPYPAEVFVSRFAAELDVPASVRARAATSVRTAADELVGARPSSIAAAAVYLASRAAGVGLTQVAVAEACGTTDSTVRARARDLGAALAGAA